VDEKLAKEKLEDEAGIYFEYSRAKYDEHTKAWVFSITNKDGRRVFRASQKEDFAPYIALSEYLKIPFETFIAEYVWIYGEEIEIIPNKMQNLFCYTQKGWLAISDIVKAFTEKFGLYSKDNSLKNITWKLVIDKNECSSSTYKKNDKPGWPNLNTRVFLSFKELEDKILKIESVGEKADTKDTEEKDAKEIANKDAITEVFEKDAITNIPNEEFSHSLKESEKDIPKKEDLQQNNIFITNSIASNLYSEEMAKAHASTTKSVEEEIKTSSSQNEEDIPNTEPITTKKLTHKKLSRNSILTIVGATFFVLAIGIISIIMIANRKYTIHFDTIGGNLDFHSQNIIAKSGEQFYFPSAENASRKGYVLIGWTDKPYLENPYKNYIPEGDYSQMKKEYHNKTFYTVWGREMYVNSDGLNMRTTPYYYEDERNVEFKLKRGDRVLMFEGCYQGEDNLWAPVVAINPNTLIKTVVFASITRLDYFYINDILLGNVHQDGSVITSKSSVPKLYANEVHYLTIGATITCGKEKEGREEFYVVIKRKDYWGNISIYAESRPSINISDNDKYYTLTRIGNKRAGAYSQGRYYIDIWHKNKSNSKCSEIRIANKEIYLH